MDIPQIILNELSEDKCVQSDELASKLNVNHNAIVGAMKSLLSFEDVNEVRFDITTEGSHILENGSHEYVVYSSVPEEGILKEALEKCSSYGKIGISKALAAKWIKMSKRDDGKADTVEDVVFNLLNKFKSMEISDIPKASITDFKKRKLISEVKVNHYVIKKGSCFKSELPKEEIDLTPEMLSAYVHSLITNSSGDWDKLSFKNYNFNAKGLPLARGHLHPLLRVRSEFSRILTEMGTNIILSFQSMELDPSTSDVAGTCPSEYVSAVEDVHRNGGYGSKGYNYDWKMSEAQKNLLRTHTTAVSSRMLYKLAQTEKPIKPVRYFSIDRVFRNETLDATHLAEFHQVEGLVAAYGIGLGHLKAVIRAFFEKLGLTKLRFKPAYNPYTEPSMEIFSFHPGLGKWVEIGNSGIFRPEMLRPMGLPSNLNVIAWGLSLERPTMIRYGYKNIRDLIGPKVDLNMIYNSPLSRIEIHAPS